MGWSDDPEVINRNLHGMANGSKLDKEIFDEFCSDWEGLSYQAQQILATYKKQNIELMHPEFELDLIPPGEYREQQSKIRVGQYFLRLSVLNAYSNKCCVTGLSLPDMLIASHMKPWAVSDFKTERTNHSNGLCLNAFHIDARSSGKRNL